MGTIRTCTEQESFKVLLDQPTSRGTSKSSRKTLGTIRGYYLYTKRAQHVDSPGSSRASILLPPGHGSSNLTVDQPMSTFDLRNNVQ